MYKMSVVAQTGHNWLSDLDQTTMNWFLVVQSNSPYILNVVEPVAVSICSQSGKKNWTKLNFKTLVMQLQLPLVKTEGNQTESLGYCGLVCGLVQSSCQSIGLGFQALAMCGTNSSHDQHNAICIHLYVCIPMNSVQ
jgi:hypothetical protein